MTKRVVPMIHVPDVAETVEWYRNIGFTVKVVTAETLRGRDAEKTRQIELM